MKDLILIPILLGTIAFGYFVMAGLDRFMEKGSRRPERKEARAQIEVRIAAESPQLFDCVAEALEVCLQTQPCITFSLFSAAADRILDKLRCDQTDLVLISGEEHLPDDESFALRRIPCRKKSRTFSAFGLLVEQESGEQLYAVWKKDRRDLDRDRVLFALENESWTLREKGWKKTAQRGRINR